MKRTDNGSLFILRETVKLMEGNFYKTEQRREEYEKVMSEAYTAIHNFPPPSFNEPLTSGCKGRCVVQFSQTPASTAEP